MAEDTQIEELSWSEFIDRLAGPLRLERPDRQACGLLATLHLIHGLWGDLALLRAAARLVGVHHFDLDRLLAAGTAPDQSSWYGLFLERHAREDAPALPQDLLKPAWRRDGAHPS